MVPKMNLTGTDLSFFLLDRWFVSPYVHLSVSAQISNIQVLQLLYALLSKYKVQVCEGIYSTPCNTIPAKQNKPSSLEMTEKTSPSPSTTPSSPFEFNSAYDSLTPREKRGKP